MGRFEIARTAAGAARFNLKAGNGEIILTSQAFETEEACEAYISRVRALCQAPVEDQTRGESIPAPKYELYRDRAGEYRFRLRAPGGAILATGEGYARKANCLTGIASVRRNAPEAQISNKK